MSQQFAYYQHLVFDNSLTSARYFNSNALAIAPSTLKAVDGKLPVSETHFISPPNSLEISWTSHPSGDWSAELVVERWRERSGRLEGDTLTFWCWSAEAIPADTLPMLKIVMEDGADRFHGVWAHSMDGRTGKVNPLFGQYDNGGDLVETAFMVQALLALRQYFDGEDERDIRTTITQLWEGVEWNWYRNPADPDFLFWHWSPDNAWHIDHQLIGWNETMIA